MARSDADAAREWFARFNRQPKRKRDAQLQHIGSIVLEEAGRRSPQTERTICWLADLQIDRQVGPGSYEIATFGRRLERLIPEMPLEPCTAHEWNIPDSGDTDLECGLCDHTRPITSELLPAVLLSSEALGSRHFAERFAQGLSAAQEALRSVN